MIYSWHEVILDGELLGYVVYDFVSDTLFGGIVERGQLEGGERWCTHPRDWKRSPVIVRGEIVYEDSYFVCLDCLCVYGAINQ